MYILNLALILNMSSNKKHASKSTKSAKSAKNPFQIPENSVNDVKQFYSNYVCGNVNAILEKEIVYK